MIHPLEDLCDKTFRGYGTFCNGGSRWRISGVMSRNTIRKKYTVSRVGLV